MQIIDSMPLQIKIKYQKNPRWHEKIDPKNSKKDFEWNGSPGLSNPLSKVFKWQIRDESLLMIW